MPKRVLYKGGHPRQLDLPAEIAIDKGKDGKSVVREVKRTYKGALHLRPGRVHVLTGDELKLAVKNYDLKKQLQVLPEPKAKESEAKGGKKAKSKAKSSGGKSSEAASSEASS